MYLRVKDVTLDRIVALNGCVVALLLRELTPRIVEQSVELNDIYHKSKFLPFL